MSLRDTMRKAAGLLVELPPEDSATRELLGESKTSSDPMSNSDLDELLSEARQLTGSSATSPKSSAPPKTIDQLVRDVPGPNLSDIKVEADKIPSPVGPNGDVDLTAIYKGAALPQPPFSAEQMREILNSLPPELPLEVKRQTVKVTLSTLGKSLGATPETIVADASRKVAALSAYVESAAKQNDDFAAKAQSDIQSLEQQIAAKRAAVENAGKKLSQLKSKCDDEAAHLDDVLEFFSLDVGPSKYAPQSAPKKPGE